MKNRNEVLNYFSNNENGQSLFLQMPMVLLKNDMFKDLSSDAKILYGLMLDMTFLSIKNNWADKKGRVYIIYTQEQIMEDLNCWENKAVKVQKELKEFGLIETVKRGLGKPNIIYVKNLAFLEIDCESKSEKTPENADNTGNTGNFKKSIAKNGEKAPGGMPKPHTNQTYLKSNVYYSDVSISPAEPETLKEAETPTPVKPDTDKTDTPVVKTYTVEEVADQISLDALKTELPGNLEDINMLFDILCEVLTVDNPPAPTYRVARQNMPSIAVKNVFKNIERRHIEYVIKSLNNNGNKAKINKNIKSYFMTSLFNAPRTIGYYFDRSFKPQDNSAKSTGFGNAMLDKIAQNSQKILYNGMDSDSFLAKLVQKSLGFGQYAKNNPDIEPDYADNFDSAEPAYC